MVMKKYEDKGLDMLSRASGDPIGRFLLRLIAPGVRKEIGKIEDVVTGVLGDVSSAFADVENRKRPRRRSRDVVVDAVIVEETPKKK